MGLIQELRHAVRSLARIHGITLVAVLALAMRYGHNAHNTAARYRMEGFAALVVQAGTATPP
jgi:AICAR transformylase/IMP cyclohydrolase PurH